MPTNPLAAFLPTSAPAQAPAPQSANPLAMYLPQGSAGQPAPVMAPAPEQDRSVGQYLGEMVGNIPGSAAQVGKDLWSAISSPVETAQAIGGAAVGGAQLLKDELGLPSMGMLGGDQRDKARAVGDYYGERYGGGQQTLDTFREDPVGAMLDAGGLLTGGAAAGARLPGVAGQPCLYRGRAESRTIEGSGENVVRGRRAIRREVQTRLLQ